MISAIDRSRLQSLYVTKDQFHIPKKKIYLSVHKGPSVYDVLTDGMRVRLRWTHADGGGVSSMWTSTQKIRAQ